MEPVNISLFIRSCVCQTAQVLATTLILSVIKLVCGHVKFLRDAETGEWVPETAESPSDINRHEVFLSLG